MAKFLILLFLCWLYKLVSNAYYLYKVVCYKDEYTKVIKDENNTILRNQEEIKRVLLKAGIVDGKISEAQPIGYGKLNIITASVYDNMCYKSLDVINIMTSAFEKAIGVYRQRIINCFNPLYWIESLIFLPSHIIKYLGIKEENIFTRLINLIYWILGFVYTVYSKQINQFIQDFLSNLFK